MYLSRLFGKSVFVTGASRGIGAAAAKEFARHGAKVALFARNKRALQKVATEIGRDAIILPGDVSSFSDVKKAIDATVDRFGSLDVLINNAAALKPIAHLVEADLEDWDKLIDTNIKGVFYANRCVIPVMIKNGGGTIITISSGAAHNPIEAWSAYCTSKAGAAMIVASTDHEYRHKGIRSMGLLPGTVATQMQKDIKKSGINPVSELNWSEHFSPELPAKALVWMCLNDADPYIGKEVNLRDRHIQKAIGSIK